MRRAVALATLVLLTPLATLSAGCLSAPSAPPDIVATFYPLGFVAAALAGDDLRVETLVPDGTEPHDFEATPVAIARLAQARLVVVQGLGLDAWANTLVANLGTTAPRVHIASAGLDGRDNHTSTGATARDPHTWLDPVLFADQVGALAETMAQVWPDHAEAILMRADALQARLADVDARYQAGLSACQVRTAVVSHDAFGYLEARYNFSVVAVNGLTPQAEPSPDAMARAIDAARAHNATVIYFEDLVSPRVAQLIADEVGATTRVLSPLEGRAAEDRTAGLDFVDIMQRNLDHLREGMRCA